VDIGPQGSRPAGHFARGFREYLPASRFTAP